MGYENFIEKYSKKIFKEDIFSDRQKQIAIDTIKNPSKALLGGPSVEESKNILKTKFGYTDAMINKLQESFKEFNKFDDVRIKSKNLAGMIYEISGNDVVINTIKGLIKTTKDDLEMMPQESYKERLRSLKESSDIKNKIKNSMNELINNNKIKFTDTSSYSEPVHYHFQAATKRNDGFINLTITLDNSNYLNISVENLQGRDIDSSKLDLNKSSHISNIENSLNKAKRIFLNEINKNKKLFESFKEQVIPMVVEEASRMFYQGFEIGAVKAMLKDKYPSISVVDINDSVDRAFSDVGSKEESFKKLKEKFIKKEYMYNNKFFSNNLEVDWVDKASGTADLILHWPDGNGKVGFTINKNNNNIKDINIIKLPNDYQGVSHGQAMMDINQEIKYYIGPEVKRKLFESYKERLRSLKEDIREGKDVMTPDGIGEYIETLNTGWILVLFSDNTKKQYPKKDIKFLESITKKESLTLDDVALEKYGKRFKDLTPEEKKYVNYVYAEWSDDSYDEGCKRESLAELFEVRFNNGEKKTFSRYSDAQIYAGNRKKLQPVIVDLLKDKKSLSSESVCKETQFKKISNNLGMKFGGYIKPNDSRIKTLDVGIGDIVSDDSKWYAIEESYKESFRVGDKFSDKYGDWVVIGFAGSKNDMYEIRGSSGSKVVDEDTLKRFFTKKESYKERLKEGFKVGDRVIWNKTYKGQVKEVHKDGMIVFDWGKSVLTSRDGITTPPYSAYPDDVKELSKIQKESYKERLNKFKESIKDDILNKQMSIQEIENDIQTYTKKLSSINTNDDRGKIDAKSFQDIIDALYEKKSKKINVKESLKEGYVQITGPFNIPKTKARLQQLCNDFGLQMTNDGRIDFNDNRSLLKREINELLGELKNLGVSYRLVESYKERLNKLNKK